MGEKQYYIEIFYQTGDSFSSENETSELEMEWDNLEIAKKNLKRIQEHYEWFDEYDNYRKETEQERENARPSFVDKKYHSSIYLISDSGNDCLISAYWCGYFETLYSAEIKERHDPSLVYRTNK